MVKKVTFFVDENSSYPKTLMGVRLAGLGEKMYTSKKGVKISFLDIPSKT
jgi:hypothetical protein